MWAKFQNLRLIFKFSILFSIIFLVSLSSYLLVFWSTARQKSDAALVDVSGRNRMLSQRIAAMAGLVGCGDEQIYRTAKEELRKAVLLHEQSIQAMKNGGIAPGLEGNIMLPAATPLVLPKILEIEQFFEGHKKLALILLEEPKYIKNTLPPSADSVALTATLIPNPTFEEALSQLQQRLINGTLLKINAELTGLFVFQAGQAQKQFFYFLLIILFVNIAVIGFAFFLLKSMIKPVEAITENIQTLAQGLIASQLHANSDDEIGHMSKAINRLSENLNSASSFAKKVGEGNLETTIEVFNNQGELAQALYIMRDNLKKVADEDKKRNWVAVGLAKFSELLRSTHDLKTLSEAIIVNLVKYVKANQGSLFLLNDNDINNIHLELIACYAFDRKKFINKQLLIGEGLAGQAYLEQETIYLSEIPNDYLKITSGLGESNPKSLLIVPLKVNNQIEGVIEMASFHSFEAHEIAFVEKLAENIASAITSVKINEKTKKLLMESQQQAEELRAQEEEMRQNLEELSATQEEMNRKEREYLKRIEELEENLVPAKD